MSLQKEILVKGLEPEKWVERYADYLYSFALSRLSRQEIAEDMVQETFLAAWAYRENFQGNSSEKTWLTSILKNKIVDHYRKSSTRNELYVSGDEGDKDFMDYFFDKEGSYQGHWTTGTAPGEWKKDLGNKLEAEEFQHILQQCLAKLPEKTRMVFVRKIMDNEESEEICKELGISSSNYWVLMHRAKLQLRECMERNWAKA